MECLCVEILIFVYGLGPGAIFQDKVVVGSVVSDALEQNPTNENFMKSENDNNEESEIQSDSVSIYEKEKEICATGEVKLSIYYKYWRSVGHGLGAVVLLSVIGMQVSVYTNRLYFYNLI